MWVVVIVQALVSRSILMHIVTRYHWHTFKFSFGLQVEELINIGAGNYVSIQCSEDSTKLTSVWMSLRTGCFWSILLGQVGVAKLYVDQKDKFPGTETCAGHRQKFYGEGHCGGRKQEWNCCCLNFLSSTIMWLDWLTPSDLHEILFPESQTNPRPNSYCKDQQQAAMVSFYLGSRWYDWPSRTISTPLVWVPELRSQQLLLAYILYHP